MTQEQRELQELLGSGLGASGRRGQTRARLGGTKASPGPKTPQLSPCARGSNPVLG